MPHCTMCSGVVSLRCVLVLQSSAYSSGVHASRQTGALKQQAMTVAAAQGIATSSRIADSLPGGSMHAASARSTAQLQPTQLQPVKAQQQAETQPQQMHADPEMFHRPQQANAVSQQPRLDALLQASTALPLNGVEHPVSVPSEPRRADGFAASKGVSVSAAVAERPPVAPNPGNAP